MRFFLTDEAPELEAELRRLGHEVVGTPADRAPAACAGTDWHPKRYNVVPHIQGHRPDVCLFVTPLRIVGIGGGMLSEFGYVRDQIVATRGTRGCVTVGLTLPGYDPKMTTDYKMGKCPKCVGGPQSFDLWATTDEATARDVARERRCALWAPGEGGAGGLIAAIEHIRGRQPYRGGREAVPFRG